MVIMPVFHTQTNDLIQNKITMFAPVTSSLMVGGQFSSKAPSTNPPMFTTTNHKLNDT